MLKQRREQERAAAASGITDETWEGEIGSSLSESEARHRPQVASKCGWRVVATMAGADFPGESICVASTDLESRRIRKICRLVDDRCRREVFYRFIDCQPSTRQTGFSSSCLPPLRNPG